MIPREGGSPAVEEPFGTQGSGGGGGTGAHPRWRRRPAAPRFAPRRRTAGSTSHPSPAPQPSNLRPRPRRAHLHSRPAAVSERALERQPFYVGACRRVQTARGTDRAGNSQPATPPRPRCCRPGPHIGPADPTRIKDTASRRAGKRGPGRAGEPGGQGRPSGRGGHVMGQRG